MFVREGVNFGGKELSIETGRMAKQADGSVVVRYGDTMVLVTAVASSTIRPGVDFMPLTVDYLEKTSAAGRIPGGYFKREGRMTEVEVLTSRLIDRPSRPLFPKGWRFDTQVIAMVVSTDRENASDVLAMTGASSALHLSDIPWAGPYAGVRVGRVDGKLIVNPTFAQRATSDLDLIVACNRDAIVMVEGGGAEVSEDVIVDALMFAHKEVQPLIDLQEKLRAAVGKPKREFAPPAKDPVIVSKVAAARQPEDRSGDGDPRQAAALRGARRGRRRDQGGARSRSSRSARPRSREAFESAKKKHLRELVLEHRAAHRRPRDRRTSGRSPARSGVLPRTHGSSLFTRGETQALVTTTLGTSQDAQHIEGIIGDVEKRFMLHYNFPPFSTGETKPLRGAEPPRDRPRPPGRARPGAHPAERQGLPLHDPHRVRDPRVERQLVDGVGLRRHAVADGRGRPDQDAGRRHRDGPHQGRRPRRRPLRHPRRRGSPRRHGLQDLRRRRPASPPSRWTSRSRG